MSEENKKVFRRYVELWASGKVDELDEVLGPGYLGHSGADPARDEDAAAVRERVRAYHAAHPDVAITIHHQVAEGDLVYTRMTARTGGGPGVAAGMNLSRFQDGKVVEEWALWERLG